MVLYLEKVNPLGSNYHGSSLLSQLDIGMSFGCVCLCINNKMQ